MLSLSSPTPITGPPKVKAAAPVLPPEPLPVAAAHHPARMHALSTPVFSSTALAPANASNRRSAGAVKEVAEHGVAERIEAADRTQQALQETLVRADAMRLELRNRLNKMQVTRNTPLPPISSDGLESDLWQYAPRKGIDFRTPPTPALLTTFSLCPSPSESVVEERIAHIRSIILPQYPPFPSLPSSTSPPLPSSPSAAALVSRLRQPSERSDWQVPTSVHAADTDATKTSVAQVKGPAQNITHSRKSHSTFTPQEKLIPPFLNRHKVMAAKSLKFVGVGKSAVQSNPTTREGLRTSRRMSRTASKSRARRSVVIPGTRRDTLDEEIDRVSANAGRSFSGLDSVLPPYLNGFRSYANLLNTDVSHMLRRSSILLKTDRHPSSTKAIQLPGHSVKGEPLAYRCRQSKNPPLDRPSELSGTQPMSRF
ncbi:hypothetical protein AcV5_010450 [Taiwanofungus camphoratus]|nr:hypothetical protein AcV5_010450 [Antrodia cinnamomea]